MPQPCPRRRRTTRTRSTGRRPARCGNGRCGSRREGRRDIVEADAVEDVLFRRQIVQQQFCGEIRVRQRVARSRRNDGLEALDGRALHAHSRGTVGARPDHRGAVADVARLNPAGDLRTISGALRYGVASVPSEATARLEVERTRNCRRVHAREARSVAIRKPSSNRDGRCLRSLTPGLRFLDRVPTILRRADDGARCSRGDGLLPRPACAERVWGEGDLRGTLRVGGHRQQLPRGDSPSPAALRASASPRKRGEAKKKPCA